jgi:hypothetical protein
LLGNCVRRKRIQIGNVDLLIKDSHESPENAMTELFSYFCGQN